ncbi:MAG: hypothetical protein ACFFCQ_01555 [Promethearchaeota archaeon]
MEKKEISMNNQDKKDQITQDETSCCEPRSSKIPKISRDESHSSKTRSSCCTRYRSMWGTKVL